MSLRCQVVRTREGALAMLDQLTGEVMHPVVGPLPEAERLYIGPSRLEARLRRSDAANHERSVLTLLDVGLGAGSNASAAYRLAQRLGPGAHRLEIVSFDRSTDALALALQAEHRAAFGLDGAAGEAAAALLRCAEHDAPAAGWRLRVGELPATLALQPAASADVVYWDPFSPRANPELWTVEAFRALRRVCGAGATVHTYSGATSTRAALLLAGFWVGTGPEISRGKFATCAALGPRELEHPLDARWLQRLARSTAPFPPDAPPDALATISALPQFAD